MQLLAVRMLLSMMVLFGCHRPVDGSERSRSPTITGRQTAMGAPTEVKAEGASLKSVVAAATNLGGLPSCIEGSPAQITTSERASLVARLCGQGLTARQPPIGWKAAAGSTSDAVPLHATEMHCVRAAVLMDQLGQAARISIVDGKDRELSSASGRSVIITPNDGVLCVPTPAELRLRVQGNDVPLTGLAVLFESP